MLHRTIGIVRVHTCGQKIFYTEEMEPWKSGGWIALVNLQHLYLNSKSLSVDGCLVGYYVLNYNMLNLSEVSYQIFVMYNYTQVFYSMFNSFLLVCKK